MPDPAVAFASLLCSRLCHDLVNPVGAIGNGLELLADEQDAEMRARCLELLVDSQRASADKLAFFRLAFGAPVGLGAELPVAELRAAVEGVTRGNARIQLGWMVPQPTLGSVPARVLLNLALIAADALVRGGRLDIGAEGGEVVVRAEGRRLVLDTETRAVLKDQAADAAPSARTSPAWLVRKLIDEAGGRIELADGEEGVLLLAAVLP